MIAKFVISFALVAVVSAFEFSNFAYNIADSYISNFKNQIEARTGSIVPGQYSLLESDNMKNAVNFVANAVGYNVFARKKPAHITSFDVSEPVFRTLHSRPISSAPILRTLSVKPIAPAPIFRTLSVRPIVPVPIFRTLAVRPVVPAPIFRTLAVGPSGPSRVSRILSVGPITPIVRVRSIAPPFPDNFHTSRYLN